MDSSLKRFVYVLHTFEIKVSKKCVQNGNLTSYHAKISNDNLHLDGHCIHDNMSCLDEE